MITAVFPENVRMAGNPIVVAARSSLDKTFLKIKLGCTLFLTHEQKSWSRSFYFSLAPGGPNENVYFDLSQVSERAYDLQELQAITENSIIAGAKVYMNVWIWEEYAENGYIYPKEPLTFETSDPACTYSIEIIPGRFSDYEQLYRAKEIESMKDFISPAGSKGRFLSRKPGGEIVPLGETVVCSFIPGYSADITAQMEVGGAAVKGQAISYIPMTVGIAASTPGNNFIRVKSGDMEMGISPSFYVTDKVPPYYVFQFVNGFNVMESITCYPKESLQYKIDTEEFERSEQDRSLNTRQRMVLKTRPVATYSMSSGWVTRAWADWFINEFLTTRQPAFMKINGKFVSANIVPGDKPIVYDEYKRELCNVLFDVQPTIEGSLYTMF